MIVMTLIVRDEADIVGANIEHHLAQGVDLVLALDNGSTDGTIEILEDYRRAGAVDFRALGNVPFNKKEWGEDLVRRALAEFGADWIIANDADEFYRPLAGETLASMLGRSPARVLHCGRRNLIGASDRVTPATWREELSYVSSLRERPPRRHHDPAVPLPWPFFYYRLPGKMVFRPLGFRSLEIGAHAVGLEGSPEPAEAPITIDHYPVRDPAEFIASVARFAAMAARYPNQPQLSGKYRRWAAMLAAGASEEDVMGEVLPDAAGVARDVEAGVLRPLGQ
jgi:hypothetical protein